MEVELWNHTAPFGTLTWQQGWVGPFDNGWFMFILYILIVFLVKAEIVYMYNVYRFQTTRFILFTFLLFLMIFITPGLPT